MEKEEKVVEIEDVDAGLKPKDVQDVKKAVKKKVVERHVLNKEQQKLFQQLLDEAKMPVKMSDPDFKLGENELDIRFLTKSNKEQMFFRALMLLNVNERSMLTSLIDITRLLMIIADKLGVEEIVKATDEIIEKIEKQTKIKEQIKKAAKDKIVKA